MEYLIVCTPMLADKNNSNQNFRRTIVFENKSISIFQTLQRTPWVWPLGYDLKSKMKIKQKVWKLEYDALKLKVAQRDYPPAWAISNSATREDNPVIQMDAHVLHVTIYQAVQMCMLMIRFFKFHRNLKVLNVNWITNDVIRFLN